MINKLIAVFLKKLKQFEKGRPKRDCLNVTEKRVLYYMFIKNFHNFKSNEIFLRKTKQKLN